MPLRRLHERALPFRAAAYPGLAVVCLALLDGDRSRWQLLVLIGWCVIWPGAAALLERRARDPVACTLRWHVAEAALLGLLAAWVGLPPMALLAVVVAVLAGVAAQAGLDLVARAGAGLGLGLLVGRLLAPAPGAAANWLADLLSATLTVLFAVALGLAGFAAVQQQFRAKTAQAESTRRFRARSERLGRYLPATAMDRLCDQPDLPRALERCWVTVAFVDLMGFTALCERLQPEETARLLNRFAALVNRLAERRGGALIRLLGDGALVGFGLNGAAHARQADPDPDYGRLARACLAFVLALRQRAAVELAAPSLPGEGIGTRCGVASGYVSLGDWGPPHRLEFTLIGSSVNLAARLQAEAPSNGVLVAEPTAALAGLDLRALRPRVLSLKGFGEVRAVALVDLKSPVTRLAGGPAPYHQQD